MYVPDPPDSGQIVGYNDNGGFLLSGNTFTELNFPGSQGTVASGINDLGQVVGYYAGLGPGPSNRGFLYQNGGFTPFDVPGSNGTVPFGINNSGAITGYYFDNNGVAHGFLATPTPAPSSFALMGFGVATLAGWRWLGKNRSRFVAPFSVVA